MSKVSISGNASGTGVFTIQAPNSNVDRVLSLPDEAGTVLTSASTANFPAGSVLQVVNAEYNTSVSTSSISTVDTGLSASITPTSASSKILVLVSQTLTPSAVGSDTYSKVEVVRDSTPIVLDQRMNNYIRYNHNVWSCCKLDSPATTSTLTYKTKMATGSSGFPVEAQHANLRTSFITLMEIAG